MTQENCSKSDLIVQVKARRAPRFKAGSDLSTKVNMVEVDFNEEQTDTTELVEVKIVLSSKECSNSIECN
jgi:hypothetical protein